MVLHNLQEQIKQEINYYVFHLCSSMNSAPMSSTSCRGDRLLSRCQENRLDRTRSHRSCNQDPISMRSATRQDRNCPLYKLLGSAIYRQMSSVSLKGDFLTSTLRFPIKEIAQDHNPEGLQAGNQGLMDSDRLRELIQPMHRCLATVASLPGRVLWHPVWI